MYLGRHAVVDQPDGKGELKDEEQRNEYLEFPVLCLEVERSHSKQRT